MNYFSMDLPRRLDKGDVLRSRSKKGYALIIPGFDDHSFLEILDSAITQTKGLDSKEKVLELTKFVRKEIEYENVFKGKRLTMLSESIKLRKGVCKEKAAILQMLLRQSGFDSFYMKGFVKTPSRTGAHAWVEVNLHNNVYIADPTIGYFRTR